MSPHGGVRFQTRGLKVKHPLTEQHVGFGFISDDVNVGPIFGASAPLEKRKGNSNGATQPRWQLQRLLLCDGMGYPANNPPFSMKPKRMGHPVGGLEKVTAIELRVR
jgi:hypothetical protein